MTDHYSDFEELRPLDETTHVPDGLGREVGQVFRDQINNSGWPYLSANVGTVNATTQSAVQSLIAGDKSPQQAMEDANQQVSEEAIE